MKIGILGTGGIVRMVMPTLAQMDNIECYAIASRTPERAEEAAKEYGFEKAYGSYEELVADKEVELVYVATPHSRHYEDMKLCIQHKKPVLSEKAFTLNSRQAREIMELAQREGVFVAEAIWPRYMPSCRLIRQMLESGVIGKVTTLTANLCYNIRHVKRIVDPKLAGGALLDVGVYGLNFAITHMGNAIDHIESSVQFGETGVDQMETITIFYKDGRMVVLTHGVTSRSDRKGIFYGEKGYIVVENINNPQSISVYDADDQLLEHVDVPKQISGYEYQFEECVECIEKGKIESDSMPLADSVFVMELMDNIREQWGLVYPQER